jgi:hypothetical protein
MSFRTSLVQAFLVICKNRAFFFPDADVLNTPKLKVKVKVKAKVKGKFHPVTGHEGPEVE